MSKRNSVKRLRKPRNIMLTYIVDCCTEFRRNLADFICSMLNILYVIHAYYPWDGFTLIIKDNVKDIYMFIVSTTQV